MCVLSIFPSSVQDASLRARDKRSRRQRYSDRVCVARPWAAACLARVRVDVRREDPRVIERGKLFLRKFRNVRGIAENFGRDAVRGLRGIHKRLTSSAAEEEAR